MEYITDEEGRRYPTDQPFTQRDQGHRAADELVYVVISDVADVLRAEADRLVKLADRADGLVKEAANLWAEPIPDDFPVKVLAADNWMTLRRATCGECGRSWDDGIATAYTPTPSGRCPFEQFHGSPDGWLPMGDEDDGEKLNDILQEAEQLDDGLRGMVRGCWHCAGHLVAVLGGWGRGRGRGMTAIDTIGIMFTRGEDGEFPTLEELDRAPANWASLYSLDIPEEMLDWSVIAWIPRYMRYGDDDREAMDETNYEALVGMISDDIPTIHNQLGSVADRYAWSTVGVEEALETLCAEVDNRVLIMSPDHDAYEDMRQASRALSDYPLLDEEGYSEREHDAWEEYWPMAYGDELREASQHARWHDQTEDVIELLEATRDDIMPIVGQWLHYYYGFSGDYSPNFLDIIDGKVADGSLVLSDGQWVERKCADVDYSYPRRGLACAGRIELSADGAPRCEIHRALVDGLPLQWEGVDA